MKIGDVVKVIQDNHQGSPLDSLETYHISIGDIGKVVEFSELQCFESIIVAFGQTVLCLAPNELEVIQ